MYMRAVKLCTQLQLYLQEYERETGQGDVLGGNNDVVHTTVKHNFHAVTSGDSLTFTECSPSSPLSRESPSTVEPPPTTEMFSISNGSVHGSRQS